MPKPVAKYIEDAIEAGAEHYPQTSGRKGGRELRCLCGFLTHAGDHAMDAVQQYADHMVDQAFRDLGRTPPQSGRPS